jgi:hypothetical protein
MNLAMDTVLFDSDVANDFNQQAKYSGVIKDTAMKIFNKPYYEYHPFIFERLPVFFFYALEANVCIGDKSPCWNNFV